MYNTWHLKGRADSNFNWWNVSSSQAWILQCVFRVDFVKISYCGSSGAQPRKVLWIDAKNQTVTRLSLFALFFFGSCWWWWWLKGLRYRQRDLLVSHPLKGQALKWGSFTLLLVNRRTRDTQSFNFESEFWPVSPTDIFELPNVWHV